ncbi:CDP-glucose 4,6-dehydratase [Ekhidna sp.]|uniref:CDP-glucose 4,6-dehydratase n=1 Tax=Ekhidna sp. TaxID=2608089 RepID=UPI003514412F
MTNSLADSNSGLNAYFKGKNVFLTGHTGFKGAWMIKLLQFLECKVTGFALKAEKESLFNLLDLDKDVTSHIQDIRDRDALSKAISVSKPEVIFHFAAQPLVLPSYEDPAYTFEVNALGTLNVLEAVRGYDHPCTVIIITTDKVYKNKEWIYGYREIDELGGMDPYSTSKSVAELITSSYISSFFEGTNKKVISARAGNVIGGGDYATNRVVPDVIRSILGEKAVELRNPEAVRPWQHVLDPLYGYLLLPYLSSTEVHVDKSYNFGPSRSENLTVEGLVKEIIRFWGEGTYVLKEAKKYESRMLELDSTKAYVELNWKQRLDTHQAIEYTIDWYKRVHVGNESPSKVTEDQITKYFMHWS